MMLPNDGDTVTVWPKPGLKVQAHAAIHGRFLSPDGEEVSWSPWMHSRLLDGSVCLTDPNQSDPPATPDKGE